MASADRVSRELASDMAEAHAEGMHAELPREGCPECEGRELRDYPTERELARADWRALADARTLRDYQNG